MIPTTTERPTPQSYLINSTFLVSLFLVIVGFVFIYLVYMNGYTYGKWVLGIILAMLSLVIVLMIFVLGVFGVQYVEQQKLFQPTVLDKYPPSLQGRWYPLKHGGGLMNTTPTRTGARRVLFLHGNSFELSKYQPALMTLEALNYDVWAIEYAGFGMAYDKTNASYADKPNSNSCLVDVMDAWSICGNSDAIVIGFSLGGAILGEVYEHLNPLPAQLVFLNTFASFPQLVAEKLHTNILTPFLTTQWVTPSPKRYKGKVTVVYTLDDTVIPPSQGRRLCYIFRSLNPQCIALESGGHRYSALNHRNEWANSNTLLPA